VGISNPGDVLYTVSNSPVTGSGTLTLTPNTQLANTVFGNFTGSAAVPTFSSAPTFSAINLTNFPALNQSISGTAATATNALSLGGNLANTYAPLANPTFTGAVSASGLISANGGLSVTPLTSSANAAYMIPWQGATAQGTSGQIYTTTGFTFNPVTGSMSLPGGLVPTAASTMNLGSVALPVWTVFSGTAGGNVGYDDLSAGMTTSAMSAQSSATCTNITGMTWTIAANKNYLLKCDIPMTWDATATAAFCLYGPGTASGYSLSAEGPLGAAGVYAQISTLAQTTWDGSIKTTASGAVAGSGIAHVWAGIRNGTTPSGTALTLGTAANGAQNITVGANAICTLTQTN
jgi:hypothetical protein